MSISARIFVAIIFFALGLSFIATTATLYHEFKETEWFTFAVFYSHLFVFFPTFGIIALIAFYIPACVFVDMYLKHVRFGFLRFLLGALLVIAASYFISSEIRKGDVPVLWGAKPEILKADKGGVIPDCDSSQQSCFRAPIIDAVKTVRAESQKRVGLSQFARDCDPDPLLEKPKELLEQRYCFVTKSMANAKQCCTAQKSFTNNLKKIYNPENQSLTEKIHVLLLPFKVFFLLVILIIGIMLATWRNTVDSKYTDYVPYIERGLIVGAFVMLIWPVTNHAFLQSQDVLYGSFAGGIYTTISPILSFLFGAWALTLLFFFFRSLEKDVEAVGKVAGVIGSAIAVLQYEAIIDYAVRIAGSGAHQITVVLFALIGFIIFIPIIFARRKKKS